MNKKTASLPKSQEKQAKSKAGYIFNPMDESWKLDKDITVSVSQVTNLLHQDLVDGYIKTLIYYAENLSSSHTHLVNDALLRFLKITKSSTITSSALINYRALLTKETEHNLARLRTLLRKWFSLGYTGVTDEITELLDSWVLKGAVKGDAIKRLDPIRGPLSDIELQAYNEGVIQAFERNDISLESMALGLVISNTGRRPIQISHLRVKDVLKGVNNRGEPVYLLNVPRAKQRASTFRGSFKQFALTHEVWVVLNTQASDCIKSIEQALGFALQDQDRLELPIFPNMNEVNKITSPKEFREACIKDHLHIKLDQIRRSVKEICKKAQIHSERTGSLLNIFPYRFRYTTGTRAAREGFGEMVIAELLDHSDTQNAGVYIENIPEHVESLDKAIGQQMARYAQAFAGVLVDDETDANRGKELNSRVKANGSGIGTCGSYGFCGASVPVPCYTCMHFQPWLNGQHEIVYDELISERKRLLDVTNDAQIAAINDRSILAVADVIKLCASRKEELSRG